MGRGGRGTYTESALNSTDSFVATPNVWPSSVRSPIRRVSLTILPETDPVPTNSHRQSLETLNSSNQLPRSLPPQPLCKRRDGGRME